MKEVKKFVIADLVIMLLKVIGGFISSSYTLIASSLYELLCIIVILLTYKNKTNDNKKAIISSIISIIIIMFGFGICLMSFLRPFYKVRFFIIIFALITLLIRYAVGCFSINSAYSKKKGLLTVAYLNSNVEFYLCGVSLATLVSKINFSILKYADSIGVILVLVLIFYKALKIIINGFRYIEGNVHEITDNYIEEISKRDEVKKVDNLSLECFGGIRSLRLDVQLKESLSIVDVNTFMVTLQDYLLKECFVAYIKMTNSVVKKKVKVRSLKQDARNSRSGNGKTNVKKQNTKKKNKKS